MANIIRRAKSGSCWTVNELVAYNISIKLLAPHEFFHTGAGPSLDHLDPAILYSPPGSDDPALSNTTAEYLGYLDLANKAIQESMIYDFARETLRILGFSERNCTLTTRYNIPLTICGETVSAQADVCLVHTRPSMILLVLTEGKSINNNTDAQSHVVAEAIAACQYNNQKREAMGLEPLECMTIPCITMSGTQPTFYLVPVTRALCMAVATGQYPHAVTEILRCVTVSSHIRLGGEGMADTEYRKLALRRFLAFKVLAKRYWETILQDIK